VIRGIQLGGRAAVVAGACALLAASVMLGAASSPSLKASAAGHGRSQSGCNGSPGTCAEDFLPGNLGGTWYWLRSPEEEKEVAAGLFTRYCIRCHGVDGKGIWDIPGIPNFTNVRWQASRSDGQIARIILEGRGAVMPPFRGALNLEEAWALARYLRTLVPGTEESRPDFGPADQPSGANAVLSPPVKDRKK